MEIWLIVGVLAIIVVLFWLNLEHNVHRLKIIIALVILLIVLASLLGWYKTGDVNFSSPQDAINSVYVYFSWVSTAAINLFNFGKGAVSTVGSVVEDNRTQAIKEIIIDGRR